MPNFWEAFWVFAVVASPLLGYAVAVALVRWFDAPGWLPGIGPLLGYAVLFSAVWVAVLIDDSRR
jgi:hypothetical protein